MSKRLGSATKVIVTLFLSLFVTSFATAITAYATPQPWAQETNHIEYWQNLGYGTCQKVDYPEDTEDTSYALPAPAAGTYWSLLVVKAGSEFNQVYENPEVGVEYDAPVNDRNNKPREISHIIYCYKSLAKVTATAPYATNPTCEQAGSLVIPATDHVTWTGGANGDGAGTYGLTATADTGYAIDGQFEWTVTVLPQLSGDDCQQPCDNCECNETCEEPCDTCECAQDCELEEQPTDNQPPVTPGGGQVLGESATVPPTTGNILSSSTNIPNTLPATGPTNPLVNWLPLAAGLITYLIARRKTAKN